MPASVGSKDGTAGSLACATIKSAADWAHLGVAEGKAWPILGDQSARLDDEIVYVIADNCVLCILTRDFGPASSCRAINFGFCVA